MNRIIGITLLAVMAQGCSYTKTNISNEVEKSKYKPEYSARIRVFNSPEIKGKYKTLESCESINRSIIESDAGYIKFRDRTSTKEYILGRTVDLRGMKEEDYVNRVIGISSTVTTESLKAERLGYDEYVIPADKPTLINLSYEAYSNSGKDYCYPRLAFLTPKAGRDYEVKLEFERTSLISSSCRIVVSEITGNDPIKIPQRIESDSCMKK